MHLYESGAFRNVASHGAPPAYVELRRREPVFHPVPEHPLAQIAATRQFFHVADIAAGPEAVRGRLADLGGARTLDIVPMLKDNELVGAIDIFRQEVRPFTDKQIALVTELRRSSRYRHRERAVAQRIASAHSRPHRTHIRPHGGAGAADSNFGGAPGYSELPR